MELYIDQHQIGGPLNIVNWYRIACVQLNAVQMHQLHAYDKHDASTSACSHFSGITFMGGLDEHNNFQICDRPPQTSRKVGIFLFWDTGQNTWKSRILAKLRF